ncbi:MAG: hypothetical protein ABSG43_18290, partial [Solirubrobacteraceae bacterium]
MQNPRSADGEPVGTGRRCGLLARSTSGARNYRGIAVAVIGSVGARTAKALVRSMHVSTQAEVRRLPAWDMFVLLNIEYEYDRGSRPRGQIGSRDGR